jgi:myo-inositol-1-phosphate synthase
VIHSSESASTSTAPAYGALLAGVCGASASTFVGGLSFAVASGLSTGGGTYYFAATARNPPGLDSLALGGWDLRGARLETAIERYGILPREAARHVASVPIFDAILGPLDYAVRVDGFAVSHPSLECAVEDVRATIRRFASAQNLARVGVIHVASPAPKGLLGSGGWSSASAYGRAAVEEGSDFVEFTPTDSIDEQLLGLARRTGSHVAGRDGATGQTILKLALKEFLLSRGFQLRDWYGTNILGNHDGLVLRHPDYCASKLADKKVVLSDCLSEDHNLVDIRFVQSAGDRKESWDCVFFSGFLDEAMSMRINWHGSDSHLAAALILDIVTALKHAFDRGLPGGLIPELGLFFKNPIGTRSRTFSERVDDYRRFLLG